MYKIQLSDSFYLKTATVIGLVSELPDIKLCYALNNDLGMKLKRTELERVYTFKNIEYLFSEFSFEDTFSEIKWNLTANLSLSSDTASDASSLFVDNRAYLIPDLKIYDYFLWYEDEAISSIDTKLNEKLKSLPYIRTFQKINLSSSKNINNLLLEY